MRALILSALLALILPTTVLAQDSDAPDGNANANDAGDSGDVIWVARYPVDTDGPQQVSDSRGRPYPATGRGNYAWFNWGGAATWKRYRATPGHPVVLVVGNDTSSINDIRFTITLCDADGGNPATQAALTWLGPQHIGHYTRRVIWFVPQRAGFIVRSLGNGFYLREVWQRETITEPLADDDESAVKELIELLRTGTDDQQAAVAESLLPFGRQAGPMLLAARDVADSEAVTARISAAIEPLFDGAEVASQASLVAQATQSMEALLQLISGSDERSASAVEARRNLFAAGPLLGSEWAAMLDHSSPAIQAAALRAVPADQLDRGWVILLTASSDDRVRTAAADRLADFDSPDTRRRLVQLAFDDPSREVAVAALMSLRKLGYHPGDGGSDSDDSDSDD